MFGVENFSGLGILCLLFDILLFVYIFVVVVLIFWFVSCYIVFGCMMYVIGVNLVVVCLNGICLKWVIFVGFVFLGLCVVIGGLILIL